MFLSILSRRRAPLWKPHFSYSTQFEYPTQHMLLKDKTKQIVLQNVKSVDDILHNVMEASIQLIHHYRDVEYKKKLHGFRVLIITPTRERALELSRNFNKHLQRTNLNVPLKPFEKPVITALLMGGHSFKKEMEIMDFHEPEVVVATPGKLSLHLKNSDYFSNVKVVFVDQVNSFLQDQPEGALFKDLSSILNNEEMAKERITIFATPEKTLEEQSLQSVLTAEKEVSSVTIESKCDLSSAEKEWVQQHEKTIETNSIEETLQQVHATLQQSGLQQKRIVIVAPNTTMVEKIQKYLASQEIYTFKIHNKLSQVEREANLFKFAESKAAVMICTKNTVMGLQPMQSHQTVIQVVDGISQFSRAKEHTHLTRQVYEDRLGYLLSKETWENNTMVTIVSKEDAPYKQF